jgi:hypothetical protein
VAVLRQEYEKVLLEQQKADKLRTEEMDKRERQYEDQQKQLIVLVEKVHGMQSLEEQVKGLEEEVKQYREKQLPVEMTPQVEHIEGSSATASELVVLHVTGSSTVDADGHLVISCTLGGGR